MNNNISRYRSGSISMYIDTTKKKTKEWLDDTHIIYCHSCNLEFNFINRKHHCRCCGKIFCYYCCNFWIKIPKNKLISTINNTISYKNQNRVCKNCFIEIDEHKHFINLIDFFDLLNLNIEDYRNILFVCKSWSKVASYYFKYFKELQYLLPNHSYSKKDINIIKNNIDLFSGHSNWILQTILIEEWLDDIHIQQLIYILDKNKIQKCYQLICFHTCSFILLPKDVIICINNKINNTKIMEYLLFCIKDISKNEFIMFMPLFVYSLRLYICNKKCLQLILEFIYSYCKRYIEISNLYFWELTYQLDDMEYKHFYTHLRKELIQCLDVDTCDLFKKSYNLTNKIVDIMNIENIDIDKHFSTINEHNIYLPIHIHKKYEKINISNIKVINSKTKPIILPCVEHSGKIKEYMIKNEDIRKEYIIMNVIKLIKYYLLQENLDLNIVTYDILPISSKYGFIEFVEKSRTLYDIREEHLFSIQNYIMEINPNITAQELRDNFTKSCASYCVITYLLGIGDRHLENIMITNKGYIFNVDFGYVLGKDPKPISPEFRITSEMIDAMGGYQSKYYNQFQYYCKTAYNKLRIYTPIFHTYLSLLYKMSPIIKNPSYIKNEIDKHVMDSFLPLQPYNIIDFQYKIIANSNTYSGNIIDFFHKKTKSSSSSSTITSLDENENKSLYESTIDAIETTKDIGYHLGYGIKSIFWKE